MRQKPAVIKDVCETFHLSNSEKTYLLTANIGEGILIMEDDHTEIKVIASPEEHKIITTNADELISKSSDNVKPKDKSSKNTQNIKPKSKLTRVSVNVDEFKGFYRHRDLNLDEIKYLLTKKYQIVEKVSITYGKDKFLVKPRFNESLNHMFVTCDIAEFLEKKNIKFEKFVTKKPDIVFTINNKKIAVEVETGSSYEKTRTKLLDKIKSLNKNYDDWFFVVTNRNYSTKYKKLGKTVEMRSLKTYMEKLVKIDTKNLTKNQEFKTTKKQQ